MKQTKYYDLHADLKLIWSGGKDMAVFLNERKPSDTKVIPTLVNKYHESRLNNEKGRKSIVEASYIFLRLVSIL